MLKHGQRDLLQTNPPLATPSTAWIYQGASADAFGQYSYLGPFNGHVNGSLLMKELRK